MPTIDASIYNALLHPQKSAMDYAEQYAAQDDRRAARQLNALQLQQAQQGMADEQALRSFMSGAPDLSKPDVQAKLYGLAPKAAGAMLKDRAAMDKEAAQTAQAKASTANSEFELNRKKIDFAWQAVGGAYTPDHARQAIQQGAQLGYFTPEQAQAELQSVPNDPDAYKQWRQQKMLSILPVKDQLDQQWKAVDSKRQQQIADESARHNKAQEGLTARGQNMTDARARDSMAQSERHFQATQGTKQNSVEAKVADARDVLGLLDMADPLIKRATSSGVGSIVDAAGGLIGASTQGADAAAQLKAIEGMLISKMPKMSGPQSDKDVLLYKQMAGRIGDSTVPVSQKQAAAKTIREINSRYAGGGAQPQGVTVVRTGRDASGRKVEQLSDGTIRHAD